MALKLKTRTQFPAVVSASSPVTVTKVGVSYTFGFDVTALRTALDPYYAVTNLNSLILNGATSGTTTVQAPAIAGTAVVTMPGVTGTLATLAGTETLTNKTLTAPVMTAPVLGVATGTSLAVTGLIKSSGTAGIGYATGAGGAVTQATSRTTGVQLDKTSGGITLFAAAPAVGTWVSCTVTNSTVAATDTISLSVQSSNAANTYIANVTTVAAGSFRISFTTIVGTTSDSPVLNFNVIKGVAA